LLFGNFSPLQFVRYKLLAHSATWSMFLQLKYNTIVGFSGKATPAVGLRSPPLSSLSSFQKLQPPREASFLGFLLTIGMPSTQYRQATGVEIFYLEIHCRLVGISSLRHTSSCNLQVEKTLFLIPIPSRIMFFIIYSVIARSKTVIF